MPVKLGMRKARNGDRTARKAEYKNRKIEKPVLSKKRRKHFFTVFLNPPLSCDLSGKYHWNARMPIIRNQAMKAERRMPSIVPCCRYHGMTNSVMIATAAVRRVRNAESFQSSKRCMKTFLYSTEEKLTMREHSLLIEEKRQLSRKNTIRAKRMPSARNTAVVSAKPAMTLRPRYPAMSSAAESRLKTIIHRM